MASVTDNPSKALDSFEVSQYVESEYAESAYGSECGSSIELQNNVEETQEDVETYAQKMKYLKKENGILQNLFTALKDENVTLTRDSDALTKQNVSLKEQNVALGNINTAYKESYVALKEKNDALQELNDTLEKDRDDSQKGIVSLEEYRDALKENIVALKEENDTLANQLMCEKKECKIQVEALKEMINSLEEKCSDTVQCKIENEKYFIDKVNSLQPILEEAKTINENLVCEVESLEKLVKKKDNNLLIVQEYNYKAEVKLSKTRKYIKHRERECNQELKQKDFQLRNLLNQSTFNMQCIIKARDFFIGKANFLENKCKNMENESLTRQHSAHMSDSTALLKSQSEALMAVKSQLEEATRDYMLSQKAYNDLRLKLKSQESLQEKLAENEQKLAGVKSSDISKDCKCQESLKQQKIDYEALKKKHAEKVKQYNELKSSYQISKKENAYNRKQSVSIIQEKQQQINDLVKQVNSLNDFKLNSINKKDHENILNE